MNRAATIFVLTLALCVVQLDSCKRNGDMSNPILTAHSGGTTSHFTLQEFTPVDDTVLESLEGVRAKLNNEHGGGVGLVITDAARTPADNDELKLRLGSAVSDTSKHLTTTAHHLTGKRIGCCAVDFYAVDLLDRERIPQSEVAAVARLYFDYVKFNYTDGHVHGDNRFRTGATKRG